MRASTASESGGEHSAVRRPWLPRTIAAVFLGAGVYAGLAIAGEVVAHADEPSATATAADSTPATATPAADAAPPTDPAPAAQTSAGTASTSSSSTAGAAPTSS